MFKRILTKVSIVFMAIVFVLPTSLAFAGVMWEDPEICGTGLHLWYTAGDKVKVEIDCDDDGEWEVEVKVKDKDCQPGDVYAAGINESAEAPGNWLFYGEATCGDNGKVKLEFEAEGGG